MSAIHVHRLTEAARPKLLEHFLRLDTEDIRLRFGSPLGSDAIAAYVQGINFDTDAVFGVYEDQLGLAAAAHVASGADGNVAGKAHGQVVSTPGRPHGGTGSVGQRAQGAVHRPGAEIVAVQHDRAVERFGAVQRLHV